MERVLTFSLDIEEADLLCPPVIREGEDAEDDSTEGLEDWTAVQTPAHSRDTSSVSTRIATFRHDVSTWAGRWGYAASHRSSPLGYRKPIPFDHVLFSTLDSKIDFEKEDPSGRPRSSTVVSSQVDAELQHEPDHAIQHELAAKLVVPHHGVRPWEDIPPYQRSRGYNDQPAYTNDYDDFLWLPRDPLSTLDLDDTVEMRLTLTTSAGGSGRIGDWPPIAHVEEVTVDETVDETWQEVYKTRDLDRQLSPDAGSEQRLIDMPISPYIGSEIGEGMHAGLVRRGTKKVGEGLNTLFKRPRSNTHKTDHSSGMISMRTLSISSTPSGGVPPGTPSPIGPEAGPSTSVRARSMHRPSIMLVTQPEEIGSRIPTPSIPPLRTGSTATAASRPETARSPTSDSFLSPTRTSTPRQMAARADSDPVEELDIGTPSRPSQLTIQLGRSPSGRKPSRLRAGSRASHDMHDRPLRSASILSPTRSRSIMMEGRGRSTSIWSNQQAAQQMWLNEVMEEERLASKDSKKEELEQEAVDHEELMKEAKRRNSAVAADLERAGSKMQSGGVGRSGSRISGVLRSASRRVGGDEEEGGRPGMERGISGESGGSGRSGRSRGSVMVYPPKTAPL